MLHRIALRHLGNVQDAEDAVQDALVSAFRHFPQFEERADVSTWLARIVINAALMRLRSRRARPLQSLDEPSSDNRSAFADFLQSAEPSPFELCRRNEFRRLLRRMLADLPPRLRRAIQLCQIQGLSHSEAAQLLNVKASTMKRRLRRARAKLACLAGEQRLAPDATTVPFSG